MSSKAMWLLFIGVSLSFPQANAKSKTKDLFNELEIESPVLLTHPVMVLELLEHSGKELVTLGVDKQAQRWLHLYKFNDDVGNYQMAAALKLPNTIARFDISADNSGHLQSIYFLDANSVFQYDPALNSLRKLTDVRTLFIKDKPDYISRGNFVVDMNEDGIDELLLPGFEYLTLVKLVAQGRVMAQQLPIEAFSVIDDQVVKFKPQPYFIEDTNGDGLKDIVIAAEGKLQSYHQLTSSMISAVAQDITLASDISAIEWWHRRDHTGADLDQANLVYRRLSQLTDINHDGILDMVVKATESSGVLDRVNDFQVFMGEMTQEKLSFPAQPSSVISAEGTLSGFELVDIDNDNKLEVILAGFDIGLSQIIGALLSGSIDQDVYIFSLDEHDAFDKKPSVSKEVELSFSLSSGQTGSALVQLADINGDGLKDLLLSTGTKRLKVYFATTGKRRFARRSVKYKTLLPHDNSVVTVSDLNGDGKDDLVMKFGRLDDPDLAQKIKLLIAK